MHRPKMNMALGGLAICLLFPFFLLANSWSAEKEQQIKQQIYCLPVQIDVHYDHQVQRYVKSYLTTGRRETEKLLKRAPRFFPVFERYLQQNNLPEELKYLPVIESRLIADAKSSAGAAGLWQFIKPTARAYDLTVNQEVDERLDVEKSTAAAMQFLGELYGEFEDWKLVLAAYNCGPGRVHRAIRRAGSRSYLKLERYLPQQTRKYIPKYIATIYAMEHYGEHSKKAKKPAIGDKTTQQQLKKPVVAAPESTVTTANISKAVSVKQALSSTEKGDIYIPVIGTLSACYSVCENKVVSDHLQGGYCITPLWEDHPTMPVRFYGQETESNTAFFQQQTRMSECSQSIIEPTIDSDQRVGDTVSCSRRVKRVPVKHSSWTIAALIDEEPPWPPSCTDAGRLDLARDKSKYVHRCAT
jgi:hypothetical protein